jgi:hypothetical protein
MERKIYYSNMFPEYEPPEELYNVLAQAAIVSADIDAEQAHVAVMLHSNDYIPQRLLNMASSDTARIYGLRRLDLIATHPADQLHKIEPAELMALFVQQNSMNRSSLAGAKWEWEGERLIIRLVGNGKKDLVECVPHVQQNLKDRFGVVVPVQIEAGNDLSGQALFDAIEKMHVETPLDTPKFASDQPKKDVKPADSDMIFGKPIKGNPVPMQDLTLDMGFVVVEGRVFFVEHKELKKRNAWIVNFSVTDS